MLNEILKFLREFPDKWLLFTLCILIGVMFLYVRNDFSSQLLNTVISALVGLLIGRSRSETKTENTINTKEVNTPSIQNEEMNNATINVADSLKHQQ